MAKKITLTIPENLHMKLEEWRSSFNMSGIFQDALSDAIKKKEEMQARMSEDFSLADIIARLKQEKQNWQKKNFDRGERQGMEWAMKAHYEDLVRAADAKIEQLKTDSRVKEMMAKHRKDAEQWAALKGKDLDEAMQKFLEGWQNGVLQFWGLVKDKL